MRTPQRFAALLMAGALAISVSAAALAQQGRGRRGAEPLTPAIIARLHLTADQQTKVKAATDAYQADITKARALTDRMQQRDAYRQAGQTYQSAVQAVLTADQKATLQQINTESRSYAALGRNGRNLAALELSADQKSKIQAIITKYQPDLEKARAAQRDPNGDRQAARTQMRELSTKLNDEIKAVLTPEQQKAFETAPARRRQRGANNNGAAQ